MKLINTRVVKYFITGLLFFISINPSFSQGIDDNSIKFYRVMKMISTFYVDTVNETKLVENAINSMLKELDPHSVYIPKKDVQAVNENLQGNFEGIGIQFNILHDTLVVIAPLSGGPSEKLGILAGDRILKIDNESVVGIGLTNEGVYKRLRGKKGSKVVVSIKRRGMSELLDFNIIRDKIPIYSRDAAYMVNKKLGYIKLNRFARTTRTEFTEAVAMLKNQGMQDLILDMRGNVGGYLDIAIQIADEFFDRAKMIVYTKGENSPKMDNYSHSAGTFKEGKLVIIIDEGSASASEIVAGAVQDWDRGVIVGRRSFGKGLVQAQYRLNDGSLIRLTTARYYTPTGRLIQKPYDNGTNEYRLDILTRINRGELYHADSIHFPDSLKFQTLNNKRTVYGGGGIMPDHFVPADTSFYSDYYRDLIRFGVISSYIYDYVDKNRDQIKNKYKSFKQFKEKYSISHEFMIDFLAFADEQEKKRNQGYESDLISQTQKDEGLKNSGELLRLQLKALIARDIWDTSEYFETINDIDTGVSEAIRIISDEKLYHKNLNN